LNRSDTEAGIAALTSIKLVVSDLKRSEAFYRSVCGFGEGKTMHFALAGRAFTEIVFRHDGKNEALMLMAYDDGAAPTSGAAVLTFSTDDLDALAQRVLAGGGSSLARPRPLRLGTWHALIAEFADPDGNLLQVLQTIEPESQQP